MVDESRNGESCLLQIQRKEGLNSTQKSQMNLHSCKSAYIFSKTLEYIRTETEMAQVKN